MSRGEPAPSVGERILGALAALVLSALTVIALPILLLWLFPVKGYLASVGLRKAGAPLLGKVFLIWISVVLIYAMYLGFKLGIYAVMDVFNQLWRTGETNDRSIRELAAKLPVHVVAAALASVAIALLF